MAENERPTYAPVRVYEYVIPGAQVGPSRVARAPRRPVPVSVMMLYRWIQARYGLR